MLDEDAPNYRTIIQHPMDMATVLQRVDCGHYLTRSSFLLDIDLIVSNAKVCTIMFMVMPMIHDSNVLFLACRLIMVMTTMELGL